MASPLSPGPPPVLHDLAAVEEALERLWQATAPGETAVMRAASFNLVAIASSEAEGRAAAAVLAAVSTELPGRVVVLAVEPADGARRLDAWIAMHCRAIGGDAQVCGEQVVVVEYGGDVARLAGAVTALLLPDCPVVGWWRGGPGAAGLALGRLAPVLDALLVDGSRFDPATLPGWVVRAREAEPGIAVGDLAWERGAAWRRWTADAFEPAALRPGLGRVAAVRVDCGVGGMMAGLLYVGWLAARLGWRPVPGLARGQAGAWTGTLGGPDGPVTVVVQPAGPAAGLVEVAIETRGGGGGVRCVVSHEGTRCAALRVTRGREMVLQHVVREAEPDEVTLVGRWLQRLRWDPNYGAALAAMAEACRGRA